MYIRNLVRVTQTIIIEQQRYRNPIEYCLHLFRFFKNNFSLNLQIINNDHFSNQLSGENCRFVSRLQAIRENNANVAYCFMWTFSNLQEVFYWFLLNMTQLLVQKCLKTLMWWSFRSDLYWQQSHSSKISSMLIGLEFYQKSNLDHSLQLFAM